MVWVQYPQCYRTYCKKNAGWNRNFLDYLIRTPQEFEKVKDTLLPDRYNLCEILLGIGFKKVFIGKNYYGLCFYGDILNYKEICETIGSIYIEDRFCNELTTDVLETVGNKLREKSDDGNSLMAMLFILCNKSK